MEDNWEIQSDLSGCSDLSGSESFEPSSLNLQNTETCSDSHLRDSTQILSCTNKSQALAVSNSAQGYDKLWSDLHLSRPLLKALSDQQFDLPTLIQSQVIPLILSGHDVLGCAQTGSGKTAAFLLPILERLLRCPGVLTRKKFHLLRRGGLVATKVLILLPTRELAIQCCKVLVTLAKHTPITHALVYGGANLRAQEVLLQQQPDILIATPGRILDLLMNSKSVHIEQLEIIILDEADRLLELGFKEECLNILKHCYRGRQTLLFSATMSENVIQFANLSLNKPLKITVHKELTIPTELKQKFIQLKQAEDREAALVHMCTSSQCQKDTIVFFQTKKLTHRISAIFQVLGISAVQLHGDMTQDERQKSIQRFQEKSAKILLATEVASRGLDIDHVTNVINFTVPLETSRYIHRVGRTARMHRIGYAFTLFDDSERNRLKSILKDITGAKFDKNHFQSDRISLDIIHQLKDKIKHVEQDVTSFLEEAKLNKEIRMAEMYIHKSENLKKYRDQILCKPQSTWIQKPKNKQTNKVKMQLNSKSQRMRDITVKRQADAINTKEGIVRKSKKFNDKSMKNMKRKDSKVIAPLHCQKKNSSAFRSHKVANKIQKRFSKVQSTD